MTQSSAARTSGASRVGDVKSFEDARTGTDQLYGEEGFKNERYNAIKYEPGHPFGK